MKRFSLSWCLLLLFAGGLAFSQDPKALPQKLTLRITSATDKPISFTASFFFKTSHARVDHVVKQTPFEIAAQSDYVNAIIVRTKGEGDLIVDLTKSKPSEQPNLKASGSIVIVGTTNQENGIYYQHTF